LTFSRIFLAKVAKRTERIAVARHDGVRAGLKLIEKLVESGSATALRLHEFS
jgi:hypothetical protein